MTTGFIRWVSATLAYVILLKCIRKVPGHTVLRATFKKVVSSPAVLADKKVVSSPSAVFRASNEEPPLRGGIEIYMRQVKAILQVDNRIYKMGIGGFSL